MGMATDLSPAEKDDKQVERLINKRPAPSRKRRPKRGPKHDNRRRRMDSDDPDVKAMKRDLKSSLVDVALRVAFLYYGDDEKAGPGRLLTRADLGLPPKEFEASYGASVPEDMSSKTAAYHGVVQQGHPSGPTNTGYNSYDKRYFGKAHFDSIIAHAKDLLKEDWLANGWDGGAEDAPRRAALDLAIQLADNNLYQSKIDAESYNMLLARLSGSDADLFSETLLGDGTAGKGKRSAAVMDKNIQNMVRIANDLRKTNPRAAFDIMKNVQAMRVAQVPVESQIQVQAEEEQQAAKFTSPPSTPPGKGFTFDEDDQPGAGESSGAPKDGPKDGEKTSQEQQGQQEQQGGLTHGPNVKDVKHQLDMFKKSRDPEQLMEVLQKLAESVKTASGRTASDIMQELAPIADMSDDEIMKLVQMGQRDVTKLDELIKGYDETKALSPEEVEAFVKGMDDFLNNIVAESEKVKTASVSVSVSALLRVATISPEAKMVVMPFLAAAKKKMDRAKAKKKKKKPAKKDAPKKGGNPFAKGGPLSKGGPAKGKKGPPAKGGKGKPPPFGGKKAPPFGKKASVDIDADDSKW